MNWKTMLQGAFEYNYAVANSLIDMVDDSELNWKPATGNNWMTTGQLLYHIAESCGSPVKGFATGDWGMPEGVDMSDMPEDAMLPPAEKLPTVSSVAEAKKLLAADKSLAFEILNSCSEERLENENAPAPWDNMEMPLGQRMMQMVQHLNQHKGQLFYYLKLQGKPVNTNSLWGA